jgi:hypothetical protein
MDKMLKVCQKLFGVVAGVALLMGVLSAPIGEVRADPLPTPFDPCSLDSESFMENGVRIYTSCDCLGDANCKALVIGSTVPVTGCKLKSVKRGDGNFTECSCKCPHFKAVEA